MQTYGNFLAVRVDASAPGADATKPMYVPLYRATYAAENFLLLRVPRGMNFGLRDDAATHVQKARSIVTPLVETRGLFNELRLTPAIEEKSGHTACTHGQQQRLAQRSITPVAEGRCTYTHSAQADIEWLRAGYVS